MMVRTVAVLALLSMAACERGDCPQPVPKPLQGGGVGEPCGANDNCGPGLECRPTYLTPGYDVPSFGSNACTLPCDAGCPGNGTCAPMPGPPPFSTCLRACNVDDDCRRSTSAGVCDAGACYRVQCTANAQCPTGFTCEIPAIVCCPKQGACGFEGAVAGYCRRG
ncbi:MAG: hypothetical protein JNK82_15910 [Myxococcaceae bacterium]|nr:hypothetical protein [Myxococcaceae bacterium]